MEYKSTDPTNTAQRKKTRNHHHFKKATWEKGVVMDSNTTSSWSPPPSLFCYLSRNDPWNSPILSFPIFKLLLDTINERCGHENEYELTAQRTMSLRPTMTTIWSSLTSRSRQAMIFLFPTEWSRVRRWAMRAPLPQKPRHKRAAFSTIFSIATAGAATPWEAVAPRHPRQSFPRIRPCLNTRAWVLPHSPAPFPIMSVAEGFILRRLLSKLLLQEEKVHLPLLSLLPSPRLRPNQKSPSSSSPTNPPWPATRPLSHQYPWALVQQRLNNDHSNSNKNSNSQYRTITHSSLLVE